MAERPLSNLDYLIRRDDQPTSSAADRLGKKSGGELAAVDTSVDANIEEALVTLATPILQILQRSNGQGTVFQLVDGLQVGITQLRPVLELIAQRFGWIELGRQHLKGDDTVSLTQRGRDYLKRVSAAP